MGDDRTADSSFQMAAEQLIASQTAAEEDTALHGQAGSKCCRTAADGTDAANQFMGGIEDRAAAWTANADGAY